MEPPQIVVQQAAEAAAGNAEESAVPGPSPEQPSNQYEHEHRSVQF